MDKELKQIFDKLNKTYWYGNLPEIEIQRSTKLNGDFGEYLSPKSKKEDTPEKYVIKISRTIYNKKLLRDTVLHEMVHHSQFIKNKNKYWKNKLAWHGKFWKEEMIRVGFKPPITRYT